MRYSQDVYIDDVIKSIVYLANRYSVTDIYNITGKNCSLLEIAKTIITLSNKEIEIQIDKEENQSPKGFSPVSTEKAHQHFGFNPLSLADGIELYVNKNHCFF